MHAVHARGGADRRAVQAIERTGASGQEFDPHNWLLADGREAAPNTARGNFVWGAGPRRCVGQSLATAELLTAMCVVAREVAQIDMSPEEAERDFPPFAYPSGMPLRLMPRTSAAAPGAPDAAAAAAQVGA
jgi:cytochrome P450